MSLTGTRPNILLFIPHDLGDTLGCYGRADVRSPRIDALATQGVRFTHCFTACPECTSSRGGLLTGYQPHQNGLMGLSNFGWRLRPATPHLASRLAGAGYATHLFGFQHEAHGNPESLGYGTVHAGPSHGAPDVCRTLCDWLATDDAGGDTPWFAAAGFSHVHRPWTMETTFDPNAVRVPAYLPDTPVMRRELACFYQAIADMDAAVGSVLDALDAHGQAQDTVVVFTTDHGAAFPRAKATLYDPGVHVPLIMRWPEHIAADTRQEALLSNLDFTPTILELAGAPIPDNMPARSAVPLLEERTYPARDYVAGGMFYDVAYDPIHYVRTRTHKYIRSFAVTPADAEGADAACLATFAAGQWIRCDDFDVLSSDAWQSMKSPQPHPPREELYDLESDPLEQHNLADHPDAAGALADMRRRLEEMMDQTDSPLRNGGHVPPTDRQRELVGPYRPGGDRYRERGIIDPTGTSGAGDRSDEAGRPPGPIPART